MQLTIDDPGGDGAPFVWAHGLMSSRAKEDSLGLFGWLRLDDVRLVRYDARGHGESAGTADPETYTWPSLAGDLLGVMDVVGLERCAVGGASMGCATAIHAALAAPQRIERLVLAIPPTAGATRVASRELNLAGARIVEEAGPQAVVDALAEQDPPAALGELGVRWREASLRQWVEMDRRLVPSILRGAAASDLPPADVLASIAAPSLVLAWSGDPAHPVSTAEHLVDVLPDAVLDVADDVAGIRAWTELVAEFLRV